MSDIYRQVEDLLTRFGSNAYVGEPVSQKEHALQSAYLAVKDGVSDTLVVAALLHDIGHLLMADADGILQVTDGADGEEKAAAGIDTRHEVLGRSWLSTHFPASVSEPVLLHVDAKRYLCAREPGYFETLSPASVRSLELQGGPMNADETAAFEQNPFHAEAVRLRHYDDLAKIPGLDVPDVEHYRERIERVRNA
ncbi:MAG: hypothetical protein SFU56_18680 [Capsulimonadales bacterium]|nr:hypothetical protein [Capsulimonadales bacterium]